MAVLILWTGGITAAWIVFGYALDDSGDGTMFNVGTRPASTPAETCEVVAWGRDVHSRFMWSQAVFVAGCYVWSFVLFVSFGIYQLRLFESLDERDTTHMDYCAVIEGLPTVTGNELVEAELCEEIERCTGHKPVGVSITWEVAELDKDFMNIIDESLDALQIAENLDGGSMRASRIRRSEVDAASLSVSSGKKRMSVKSASDPLMANTPQSPRGPKSPRGERSPRTPRTPRQSPEGFFRRITTSVERLFLTQSTQTLITKGRRRDFEARHTEDDVNEEFDVECELRAMHSCSTAFAVFESEEARDAVVDQACKVGGLCFRNAVVQVKQCENEPESVCWANFQAQHVGWMFARVLLGVITIIAALVLWTLVFYLPYAYYYMSFNYGQGQWPGVLEETTFILIIVCGNATMYFLCSEVADRCGFSYIGDRELCYLLLYYFSCLLNVVLDLVCSYHVVFMALVGVGARTSDGVPLSEIETFTERFESYPMQRELGWTVFAYAFPSTFLIPFIAEPLATIVLPYKVMTAIVGYRPDIQGCRADFFLASTPFDLSRYADIALNAALGTLVFWFPSGLTLAMFGTCFVSHIYIYAYDHYRVLRSVPSFSMSSMRTDWWAQAMLAIPTGGLVSCFFYKANCVPGFEGVHPEGLFGHCKQEDMLVAKCAAAFALHVAVHMLFLVAVVPLFGHSTKEPTKIPYSECARRLAHSYFSVNAVHCLRSEYMYGHTPPFVFSRCGKEHLMPQHPEIGAYFSDVGAAIEDYSGTVETLAGFKDLAHVPRAPTTVRNPRSAKSSGDKTKKRSSRSEPSA